MRTPIPLLCAALMAALAVPSTPAHAGGKAPTVKLQSPGKGPRRPLRYALQTGSTDTAVMRMGMSMKNRLPGMGDSEIVIPWVDTDITVNLGERRGADEHLMMFSIDDMRVETRPGVIEGVTEAMKGMLDKMKGMTGSAYINTRGVTRESSFLIPAGLPPEVRQMLEQTEDSLDQMSAPLPVEAVGKGARWRITSTHDRGGMKTTDRFDYEVVALAGDRVELKVTITQTAGPQVVTAPTGSYELVSYKGKGSGRISLDLRHPVPESKVTMTVDQVARIDMGTGKKEKMPTHIELELVIGRK